MRKKSIECWIYNRIEKQFLLLLVSNSAVTFWQPITGGIKRNESSENAAIREIYEETGIIVEHNCIFSIGKYSVAINADLVIDKQLYSMVTTEKYVKISKEHADYRWGKAENIPDNLKWKNNIESFTHSLKLVQYFFV
ncbi:dihydroneopterin triphosphate pyrophosphatase [Enterococcus durans]|uniref:Dihydroneopterin triphosphate pyrophosphatase n=2 Tax=Enterococcus durans TaxID=53345 RepID=A0A377KQ79_9ENTE|nr:NUDIX domain-containing protein [Enterococcus durans]STP30514.1 dihydroneopterin triphosphate pyrophosphatase [Enterococcus durans]